MSSNCIVDINERAIRILARSSECTELQSLSLPFLVWFHFKLYHRQRQRHHSKLQCARILYALYASKWQFQSLHSHILLTFKRFIFFVSCDRFSACCFPQINKMHNIFSFKFIARSCVVSCHKNNNSFLMGARTKRPMKCVIIIQRICFQMKQKMAQNLCQSISWFAQYANKWLRLIDATDSIIV